MKSDKTTVSPAELLGLTFILSFCSLAYEMTIAGCFVAFTGDAPLWQSLTIGLYLASVGLGTWTCNRWVKSDAWRALWGVELALTVVGALSAVGVLSIETAFRIRQHFYQPDLAPTVTSALLAVSMGHGFTLAIGWLSGFEIPLLLRIASELDSKRDRTQEILGWNYFGGLAGSLVFSFWLLPKLDLTGSAAAASALNLAACAFIYKRKLKDAEGDPLLPLAGVALAWAAILMISPLASKLNVVAFYAGRLGVPGQVVTQECCARRLPGLPSVIEALWGRRADIERIPSRIQRIELVNQQHMRTPITEHFNRRPAVEEDLPFGMSLFHDRRYQFYGGSEAIYHEFFTHVPIQLFSRVPKDALILGGGDGLLAKELLKYGDRVRTIVNVELDPAMVALARGEPRLRRLNNGAFRDPKVEVVVDDAFGFIRSDPRKFDAIYIDFPYPYTYDASKLYTVEFYRNVAAMLKPGGYVAMDYPLISKELSALEKDPEDLRRNSVIVNTLKGAGFRTIVPYSTESTEPLGRSDGMFLKGPPLDPENDQELGILERRIAARRFNLRNPALKLDPREDYLLVSNTDSRETMLTFTYDRSEPNFEFKDFSVPLYALTRNRMRLLEGELYPYKEDKSLINSVVRPTLFRSLQFIERD